jgi:hypothetical protein
MGGNGRMRSPQYPKTFCKWGRTLGISAIISFKIDCSPSNQVIVLVSVDKRMSLLMVSAILTWILIYSIGVESMLVVVQINSKSKAVFFLDE